MFQVERAYAAIDLDALHFNLETIAEKLEPDTKICAVIKADAYGHGIHEIGKELQESPHVSYFATATIDEANALRASGVNKPIIILGACFPSRVKETVEKEYRSHIFTYESAKALSDEAVLQGKKAYIHIGLDTGMNRLGYVASDDIISEIEKVVLLPNLELEGLFTHLAKADMADQNFTYEQINRYKDIVKQLEQRGITAPIHHCANSAGTMEEVLTHMDMVRTGIIMYGIRPSEFVGKDFPLKPVLSLKSTVIYLKKVPKGERISYGGTYVLPEEQLIATIPIGYGDGYPRNLSNQGYVLINGKKAPIRGKICMDLMMVDVTNIPNVKIGTEVVLIGRSGNQVITAEELGELSGRFAYEFVCDLGKRIPRVYFKKQVAVSCNI